MKFHAVAMCLAGTLATGLAASALAEDTKSTTITRTETFTTTGTHTMTDNPPHGTAGHVCMAGVPLPGWQGANLIEDIAYHNRKEAAMLAALGSRARTVGYDNIGTVYTFMSNEHARSLDDASAWLAQHHLKVPEMPDTVVAVNAPAPEASVDMMIAEHMRVFNRALELRKCTTNAAARGMLLKTAAESARHITLLNALDRDVDRGRRTLSASLQGLMDERFVASNYEEWIARVVQEETTYYTSVSPQIAQTPYTIPPEPEVRVAEQPAQPAPTTPPAQAEQPTPLAQPAPVAERPAPVQPQIAERPAPTRQRVLGNRQQTRPRMRRPAH